MLLNASAVLSAFLSLAGIGCRKTSALSAQFDMASAPADASYQSREEALLPTVGLLSDAHGYTDASGNSASRGTEGQDGGRTPFVQDVGLGGVRADSGAVSPPQGDGRTVVNRSPPDAFLPVDGFRFLSSTDGPEECAADKTWFFPKEYRSIYCGSIGEACLTFCGTTTACVVSVAGLAQQVYCPQRP